MIIKISKIRPDAIIPRYQTDGAGCFDFEAIERISIKPNQLEFIPTGLVIQMPKNHFLTIVPRSSTAKLGLIMPHSIGIIDSDYSGVGDEIKILLKNTSDKEVVIEKSQRIAQGYITATPKVVWNEIPKEELSQKSRGGFGSTGK